MTQVIEKVGVVGCGLMGSGIAEVAARAGLDVTVTESSPSAAEAGMARVATSLKRAVTSGRLTDADHDAAWDRLAFGHQLEALVDCDLVIEAVAEDEAMKIDVFGQLDEVCKPRGRPGVEHIEHPDHETRTGNQARSPGDRHPLLQPGAGASAGRTGHLAADLTGDRDRTSRSSPPTRSVRRWSARAIAPDSSSTRC